ncbi:hypothetical protein K474DRAFT_1707537 [Panus rudis PR-1116 ss-1]|nr:hypothetical protein K474DRAFT_1707537 [Panus rudis PR-1116 ss-1]
MFVKTLAFPLALLLWPLSLALAQGQSLTPPPVSAPEPSGSAASTTSAPSSVSSGVSASSSGSANVSSSASVTSSAEFPSLSGYSPCVANCLGLAISQTGCSSIVDVQCFCNNATRFTRSLVGCISKDCPSDLSNAESLSQQFCNVASPSVSLSFSITSIPSSSASSSSNSASATSSSSSASSSAAPSPSQSGDTSGTFAVRLVRADIGGALVVAWGLAALGFAVSW